MATETIIVKGLKPIIYTNDFKPIYPHNIDVLEALKPRRITKEYHPKPTLK